MLTIDEIKDISFRRAGKNGYNAADVDEFIDEVTATVEQLVAEKNDCIRKMDILANKVDQYRKDEETLRNAVFTAEKLKEDKIKEAESRAEYIIKTAEQKRNAILTEAEMATEREKNKFEALQADTAKLREAILAIYEEHQAIVKKLPSMDDVKATREKLDEKYPFEPVEDVVPAELPDVPEEQQAALVEPDVKEAGRPELKRERHDKFDKLEFGDNYDV